VNRRVVVGFLVAAFSLGVASYLHEALPDQVTCVVRVKGTCTGVYVVPQHRRYVWQDPLGFFVAVAGIGVGLAIVLPALRR
jgi:hypothetical protein